MRRFEFATAARIIFGDGSAGQLASLARDLGGNALLFTDDQPERVDDLIHSLKGAGLRHTLFPVAGEPSVEVVNRAVERALSADCDLVISIGGGSVIDSGKATAALIPNGGDALDYLEVIGKGQKLQEAPLPFIALPTTAGTGAEVTKNAVLASQEHRVKVSLRDNRMLADIALVDPLLTHSMPPSVTASTGMDALAQVLEPYVSCQANPLTDGLCVEGLRRAGRSLRRVYAQPDEAAARADMALTSLLGGLALANAKLGAVHGFAGVLGGMYNAPHGAICAALLPPVIKANVKALEQRQPDNPILRRYEDAAGFILFDRAATANESGSTRPKDAMDWIEETSEIFAIPGLGAYGIEEKDFDLIVEKSAASSSMKGNPLPLTHEELKAILVEAL
ncbi:MAG: iron-containing alcohol dehydrogenase [Chloroflexota bacterium]|nr:iron-containing alcohol dehydrogenase [Chloroflexota bacterium]